MDALITFLVVLGPIVAANVVAKKNDPEITKRFTWILAILNFPIILLGFAYALFPASSAPLLQETPLVSENTSSGGITLILSGVWAILNCSTRFRTFLARLLPIDSASPVHMTSLVLAGYLVASTAIAQSEDLLLAITTAEVTVSTLEIVLQFAALTTLAYIGAGWLTRRNFTEVNSRLGLSRPTMRELAIAAAVVMLLLIFQGTAGAVWFLLDPQQAQQLGATNEALLASFDTVGEWLILALASGVSEELLFRGALQPAFGIPLTSLLFAIVHIQYGLTPVTLIVFILGIVLGIVRRFTNTTVAIFVHFGYNFMLGLLSMLALYLEQFATP